MTTSPEKNESAPVDGGATAMPIDPAQHPALAKQRRAIAPVGVIAALAGVLWSVVCRAPA